MENDLHIARLINARKDALEHLKMSKETLKVARDAFIGADDYHGADKVSRELMHIEHIINDVEGK